MWLLLARGIRARGRLTGRYRFRLEQCRTAYSRSIMRNAPPNIEFGGYRPASALAEEFRRADIFCSPSVWEEPFGLVNVEAMASGLPVVSTRRGGVPEIFADGGGVLVQQGSATELASALEGLIRNAGRRRELGTEGYSSFQRNFTWKTVHRRYREVLAGLDQPKDGGLDISEVIGRHIRSRSAGGAIMPDFSLILATSGRTRSCIVFSPHLRLRARDCECIVVDQNPDERLIPILAAWEG